MTIMILSASAQQTEIEAGLASGGNRVSHQAI
jgi:hypothetical protein